MLSSRVFKETLITFEIQIRTTGIHFCTKFRLSKFNVYRRLSQAAACDTNFTSKLRIQSLMKTTLPPPEVAK